MTATRRIAAVALFCTALAACQVEEITYVDRIVTPTDQPAPAVRVVLTRQHRR